MNELKVFPIGKIEHNGVGFKVTLNPKYKEGLKGLADYSHVQVLWWFDGCGNSKDRGMLLEQQPYKNGPKEIGVLHCIPRSGQTLLPFPMQISHMLMRRPAQ